VRRGRGEEFADFRWSGELPDPQDERTFLRSKLSWELRQKGDHRVLLDFYKELFRLRREIRALRRLDRNSQEVHLLAEEKTIFVRRWDEKSEVFAAFHFAEGSPRSQLPIPTGRWTRILDSADSKWKGPGSDGPEGVVSKGKLELRLNPWSIVLYERLDKS